MSIFSLERKCEEQKIRLSLQNFLDTIKRNWFFIDLFHYLFHYHLHSLAVVPYFHCLKSFRIGSFSGPHFFAFGLNADTYSVSLRIQSEWWQIWPKNSPSTDTFHAASNLKRVKSVPFRIFSSIFSFKRKCEGQGFEDVFT